MANMKLPPTEKRVEWGNSLDVESYKSYFMSDLLSDSQFNIKSSSPCMELKTAESLSATELKVCFELIKESSFQDYAASSIGWHPKKKLKEMRLPDLRYLLVRAAPKDTLDAPESLGVQGFMSFMLTYEDGEEVIYMYEIHLALELRGLGLGTHLLKILEETGRRARMEKSMFTVFKCNKAALGFYEHAGYEVDKYSPQPRRLRNGTTKEPDYVIMSKSL